MGVFTGADEVYRFIGGIFEEAAADPELSEKLAASGVVLKLNYSDPDSTITVDMPEKKVYLGTDIDKKATVEMYMTADVAHKFWLGKVNLASALGKGEMRAKGPVPKILKLIPIAQQLFPRYTQSLKDAGRDDLLEV